jgi:hypothetical protein
MNDSVAPALKWLLPAILLGFSSPLVGGQTAGSETPANQPVPRVYPYNLSGPFTVLAGYRSVYYFKPDYTFTMECNPSADRCTARNYTPVNGEIGTVSTTGTPPGGLYTVAQTHFPQYALCEVSGSSFRLHRNDCGGAVERLTSPGTGVQTFVLYNWRRQPIYLEASPSGFPDGTQFDFQLVGPGYACNTPAPVSRGKVYRPAGGDARENALCMFVTVPKDASPGPKTVGIRTCADPDGHNCGVFDFPIDVVRVPETPITPPKVFPRIPGRSNWEDAMSATGLEAGAGTYCRDRDHPTETFAEMPEASVAYYDGILMYLNIAEYTKNPAWRNCALNIARFAKDYLVSNKGGIPAYKLFCEGLARASAYDPSLEPAIRLLQQNTFLRYGAQPVLGWDREMAYALSASICLEKHFGIKNRFRGDFRDTLYGFLLKYTESDPVQRGDTQTFYLGVMAKAIIEDAEDDPSQRQRALYTVRRVMERIDATYDHKAHSVMYATGKDRGPWCLSSPLWFHNDPYYGCEEHKGQKLQALAAPMFAWYWSLTGDKGALTLGDDLFSHALDARAFTGKEISQIFFWTFEFVRWRSGTR